MLSTPSHRALHARVGIVLLACTAVVLGMLGTSRQPARAAFGDFGCLPSNDLPDYSISVSGPNGSSSLQPINEPVELTLVGSSGGRVDIGRITCSGVFAYDLDVRWDTLPTTAPAQNPLDVSGPAVGTGTYRATLLITETGIGALAGLGTTTLIHQVVTATVTYFGVAPTGTAVSVPTAATAGEPAQLTATTQNANPVAGWAWDFGDGTPAVTGPDATVTHTYAARGTYDVTATVTDSLGLTDSATEHIAVYDPLVAAFTATPSTVGLLSPVRFDASGSTTDSDAPISAYAWDFGDGLHGTGAAPAHAYQTTGTFPVTETVTDSVGRTATASHDVTVVDLPAGTPPVASFATTTANPTAASPVSFDATGSSDDDGSIVGYAWTFGDGGTDTRIAPQHTFAQPGGYPVTLTVTDDDGLTTSVTQTVTIAAAKAAPVAAFDAPAGAVAASPVAFDGTSSSDVDGTVRQYAWTFGDGASGTGATPAHAYAASGAYTVTLTVTDDDGLTGTASRTVDVAGAPPVAAFTAPAGAAGVSTAFDGTGSSDPDGSIRNYAWDFGDGGTAVGATPGHTFAEPNTYPVTLTVTDDSGLTGSVTHLVTVGAALPTAVFVAGASAPTVGAPVSFDGSGSSAPGAAITRYAWRFGDGGTGTGVRPSHTYKSAGGYPVTLTVTDAAGRTAPVTHVIEPQWPATDLAVAVGGSVPKAGQYTYRVTVKNLGHAGAHGIVLTNVLDPTQTLLSSVRSPAGLACRGVPVGSTGTITCKASPRTVLAAGKSWVVTFTVKQPGRARARQVTETSSVRAANADGVTRNNAARLTTAV